MPGASANTCRSLLGKQMDGQNIGSWRARKALSCPSLRPQYRAPQHLLEQ